jgi:hypothetical protein
MNALSICRRAFMTTCSICLLRLLCLQVAYYCRMYAVDMVSSYAEDGSVVCKHVHAVCRLQCSCGKRQNVQPAGHPDEEPRPKV